VAGGWREGRGIITYEIVEDSEEAFEVNVTECILAEPMLELDAGKIANPAVRSPSYHPIATFLYCRTS